MFNLLSLPDFRPKPVVSEPILVINNLHSNPNCTHPLPPVATYLQPPYSPSMAVAAACAAPSHATTSLDIARRYSTAARGSRPCCCKPLLCRHHRVSPMWLAALLLLVAVRPFAAASHVPSCSVLYSPFRRCSASHLAHGRVLPTPSSPEKKPAFQYFEFTISTSRVSNFNFFNLAISTLLSSNEHV